MYQEWTASSVAQALLFVLERLTAGTFPGILDVYVIDVTSEVQMQREVSKDGSDGSEAFNLNMSSILALSFDKVIQQVAGAHIAGKVQ